MTYSGQREPMVAPHRYMRTATRFTTNRNWCRRGDNTKYRDKK